MHARKKRWLKNRVRNLMEGQTVVPGTTCGTCKHWQDNGVNPQNIAAPHAGMCRRFPPVPVIIPLGNGQAQILGQSPPCDQNTPACGEYAGRVTLAG